MNSSGKSKRKLEKFLNNNREKNEDKDSYKLNNNSYSRNNNNSYEKKKYQYEYSNAKQEDIDINSIKNDDDEKNILIGLINEGLVSLNELSENYLLESQEYDINNLQFKDINYEKLIKKIIFLNKSLKNTQNERFKLESEHETFSNAINESNLNNKINMYSQNENSNFINQNRNGTNNNIDLSKTNNMKSQEILKKYIEDLNYFSDLININNNCDEFK